MPLVKKIDNPIKLNTPTKDAMKRVKEIQQDPDRYIQCRSCKNYRRVYSPCPGESWDRCAMLAKEGEKEYCGNLNHGNDCRHYRRSFFKAFFTQFKPVQWWRVYY